MDLNFVTEDKYGAMPSLLGFLKTELANFKVETLAILAIALAVTGKLLANRKKPKVLKQSSKRGFYKTGGDYKPPVINSIGSDFVWNKNPPLKSYPFKDAEYKLTMGVKRVDPEHWLLIEPGYLKVLDEKKKIVTNTHSAYEYDTSEKTVFQTPQSEPAIREFYDIVVKHMCDRYPMYFNIKGDQLHNLITDEYVPARSSDDIPARDLMIYLTRVIEEDFIFMMKDPDHQEVEDEYYFKGGVFAFAAGFDPVDKFNQPMTSIHKPIPGYEEKLKASMNKFFNRLSPGQFITRNNFSLQTHDLYFVMDDNKGYHKTEIIKKKEDELDFETQVHYRSERQVLTRLPKSGAVVFTIRTYLIPLADFRKEGKEVCERLIGSLTKMPEDIRTYKNVVEWGDAVVSYLKKYDQST